MNWPHGKDFAFTIVDDTDFSTIQNTKPVYDLLLSLGLRTTKTVWVYPSRDKYAGESLQSKQYLDFVRELKANGFEIASHGVASGDYKRAEILSGFEEYRSKLGEYPRIHINHAQNKNNLYWGYRRFQFPFSAIMALRSRSYFSGELPDSDFFWGDFSKKHIRYIRNLTFSDINTLKADPLMPHRDPAKEQYSNLWFSSSDGHTVDEFNDLLSEDNIKRLKRERGCAIIYTHFASGFTDANGKLNDTFARRLEYLSSLNGWFAPAGTILDHLNSCKQDHSLPAGYLFNLNLRWFRNRVWKKWKYKR